MYLTETVRLVNAIKLDIFEDLTPSDTLLNKKSGKFCLTF